MPEGTVTYNVWPTTAVDYRRAAPPKSPSPGAGRPFHHHCRKDRAVSPKWKPRSVGPKALSSTRVHRGNRAYLVSSGHPQGSMSGCSACCDPPLRPPSPRVRDARDRRRVLSRVAIALRDPAVRGARLSQSLPPHSVPVPRCPCRTQRIIRNWQGVWPWRERVPEFTRSLQAEGFLAGSLPKRPQSCRAEVRRTPRLPRRPLVVLTTAVLVLLHHGQLVHVPSPGPMLGSRTHEESGYLYTTQGPGASTSGGAGLPGVWSLGHTDPIPERDLHFRASQGDQSGRGAAMPQALCCASWSSGVWGESNRGARCARRHVMSWAPPLISLHSVLIGAGAALNLARRYPRGARGVRR